MVAFAYVAEGAWLGWLEVGYTIFKENMQPEDTFSFLPTKDKEGKIEGIPRYAEIGNISRALWSEAKMVRRDDAGEWKERESCSSS